MAEDGIDMEKIFPLITEIKNEELRKKIEAVYEKAVQDGGWDDIHEVPFTLLTGSDLTYVDHVRAVSRMVFEVGKIMKKEGFGINLDFLLAGALLHDVGKLIEYKKERGRVVKSELGRLLRHPISGANLAKEMGLPKEVIHIIATHSKEGDYVQRSIESIIVHHCDFIYFESAKT